ncbi:tetratricopeptide repeat protein [Schlesneria paludicola]|uniref:tetratricopeptide repeat protein n=1 Tax=Schlesneria paludicola TaxID=360056 RepID=UPI00029B1455|nr:tetratricopeptide repeat protein [Schlesneria paludicola]
MSIETISNNRVSIWQRAVLLGLIAVFVTMGISRLNDCDLFNPDSPRYLIYSQALVDLGDYRATDLPGAPLYSWRPPGLSLLLAPAMALRPYDVIAAKLVILVTGAALLWVVFELAMLHCQFVTALFVTAAIATSPSFLVLSTEVLTEVPYTLGVLLVLLLLSRSTIQRTIAPSDNMRFSRGLTIGLSIVALAFTPWLRTAGVSLVAAVAIWSILSRSRWHWLSTVAVAGAGMGLLAWRNKQAGGENYVGSLLTRLREQGVSATITSGIETIGHYLTTLPGLLLPGFSNERPWYAPLTLDASPTLGLTYAVTAGAAALLLLVAVLGMTQRRANGGSLAFLYIAIYGVCLIVWPWRHERFLWPLIPVLMIYFPAGISVLTSKWPLLTTTLPRCGVVAILALSGWQCVGCEQLVRVNLAFVKAPHEFHLERAPGFYFSNWRRAGLWLNAHTPPTARVLTWHAAVAGTAHRFQKRVQFETLSVEKLRQQIEAFSARYLVVPAGQFGDGFCWQVLEADPTLRFKVVYQEDDVAILEVSPNRTGEVIKSTFPIWLEHQLESSKEACDRNPTRTDLAIRHASLLREAGANDKAIEAFLALKERGIKTARVYSELGWLLFEKQEYAMAAELLDAARILPNAEAIASILAGGAARARERLQQGVNDMSESTLTSRLNRVKSLMSQLKYAQAEKELDEIVAGSAENPEVLFVRGRLHHRLGEETLASDCYERCLQLGNRDAIPWLRLIRFGQALSGQVSTSIVVGGHRDEVNPAKPEDHLQLARQLQECGWSGRALKTLEQANQQFPEQNVIQRPLADLYRSFAMPEQAMELYQQVLVRNPHDDEAQKGLNLTHSILIEPAMSPLTSPPEPETFAHNPGIKLSNR